MTYVQKRTHFLLLLKRLARSTVPTAAAPPMRAIPIYPSGGFQTRRGKVRKGVKEESRDDDEQGSAREIEDRRTKRRRSENLQRSVRRSQGEN